MLIDNTISFVPVAGLLLTFLVHFGLIVRRISVAEHRIHSKIETIEHELEIEINKVRRELLESKLEAANSFMKKDVFKDVMSNLDARLIRLEGKLDSIIAKT